MVDPVEYAFSAPDELQAGVYANMLGVWHSGHEFTLDFASTLPPQKVQREDGTTAIRVPCRVVARVKVPPTVAFDIIQALNDNLTKYEDRFGHVRRPGEDAKPLVIPDDLIGPPPTGPTDEDSSSADDDDAGEEDENK